MDISATQITDLPANPRLLAKDQAQAEAQPQARPAPAAPDPASLAGATARLHAEKAESLAAQMTQSLALYNANNASAIEATVSRYRVQFGDEMAERADQSMRLLRADATRQIEALDLALKTQFQVEGTTHRLDKETDRALPGPFTARLTAPDYAVRYDSRAGAEISVLGGPFTAAFPRSAKPPAAGPLLDIRA